jgi:multisubunit Na+/H+ antiporter MnhE subunit
MVVVAEIHAREVVAMFVRWITFLLSFSVFKFLLAFLTSFYILYYYFCYHFLLSCFSFFMFLGNMSHSSIPCI